MEKGGVQRAWENRCIPLCSFSPPLTSPRPLYPERIIRIVIVVAGRNIAAITVVLLGRVRGVVAFGKQLARHKARDGRGNVDGGGGALFCGGSWAVNGSGGGDGRVSATHRRACSARHNAWDESGSERKNSFAFIFRFCRPCERRALSRARPRLASTPGPHCPGWPSPTRSPSSPGKRAYGRPRRQNPSRARRRCRRRGVGACVTRRPLHHRTLSSLLAQHGGDPAAQRRVSPGQSPGGGRSDDRDPAE